MSSFGKDIGNFQVSHEYTQLEVVAAKVTTKDKVVNGQMTTTKIFKEVAKAKTDKLKVQLTASDLGQQLTFCFQRGGNDEDAKDPTSRILATFTMTKDFQLSLVCNTEFNEIKSYVYKPLLTQFQGIEASSISSVFSKWLCSNEFFEHLKIVSSQKGYTPALVKMLMLYISYQDVKDEMGTELGQLPQNLIVDIQEVAKVFRANLQALQNKLPRMAQHYKPDLMLSPADTTPQPENSQESTVEVVETINAGSNTDPIAEEVEKEGQTIEIVPEKETIDPDTEESQPE
jgi:hypothetical protein